ncbi:MAG: hypothetical protein PVG78_08940 [Desulfobacterales bacterium]
MNYAILGNFSQKEKVALLKLLIKIAYSDGEWSDEEKSFIKDYLMQNDMKCTGGFVKRAVQEDLNGILSVFESCKNLERGKTLSWGFAKRHGIAPDFERSLLSAIDNAVQHRVRKIESNLRKYIQTPLKAFVYLWCNEDLRPSLDRPQAV